MTEPRDDIDRRLQDWYGAQEPSQTVMERARALTLGWRSLWRRYAPLAAASVVASLALTWWFIDEPPYADTAAAEIATNHLKGYGPEFPASAIEQLSPRMGERLGFELVTPTRVREQAEVTIVGGRYCSVGGIGAAQVACRGADGERLTLYLWPAGDDLPPGWSSTHLLGDTTVTIWREGHLLAGLAGPR
ncbi:MAG: hypothetical protein CMJ90_03135 [Planctomycetes bacterium]|nr:hypothetical protein [Planctomycetota bacterium]